MGFNKYKLQYILPDAGLVFNQRRGCRRRGRRFLDRVAGALPLEGGMLTGCNLHMICAGSTDFADAFSFRPPDFLC